MFDLSKTKVSDLSDEQIGMLKDYLLTIDEKDAQKFFNKVVDKEYHLGDNEQKVEIFLRSPELRKFFNALFKEVNSKTAKNDKSLHTSMKDFIEEEEDEDEGDIKKEEEKKEVPVKKIKTKMSNIKDLFLKLTKTTMPMGHEHLVEKYLPKGWKKDFHGNYYIVVGDPTTMFTSHVDTAVDKEPKEVTHVENGEFIETDKKTILGADDKAGTTIMIHMINKKVTGLYYFFLCEEHGCVGSRALNTYLDTHRDDELYKKITKVISLDRRDYDSIITFQDSERCCSEEFGHELAKRLNEAGGFKYRNDPTGAHTDSHQVASKFAECTNLSVGYDAQHTVNEKQNIVFLEKLAEACTKVDWETLPIKRDPTKIERNYSSSWSSGRSSRYVGSSWEDDQWWKGTGSSKATKTGPSNLPAGATTVIDYLGNEIEVADAQWCEYDQAYCEKTEAIWVDYIGFYTTPDFDPSKVKPKKVETGSLTIIEMGDIKKDLKVYQKNGDLFGTVVDFDNNVVTVETAPNSKFITPPDKFLSYEFLKKSEPGGRKLTADDLKIDLPIIHPSFGEGKIIGIRPDKVIIKVNFKNKGEKDLRVDVANMAF